MLEKLLNGLDFVERHSVGVVDEGITKLIQVPSEWLEREGISRQDQIDQLKLGAFSIALYNSLVSMQPHLANIFKDHFAYGKAIGTFALNFMSYSPLLAYGSSDLLDADNNNNDGAIALDPFATLRQRIRPYFLGASLIGINYGLENGSREAATYGAVALPLAISMYISGGSTGLWQKIKENTKAFFSQTALNQISA